MCILSISLTKAVDVYCAKNLKNRVCEITISPSMTNVGVYIEEDDHTLRCISCDIQSFPIRYTRNVKLLSIMDFSNSHIKTIHLEEVHDPDALTVFNVSNNQITKLNDTSLFTTANKLLRIDLSHNHIYSLSGNALNRFVTLHQIDVSFNVIDALDEKTFTQLHALHTLKINNNLLTSVRNLFNETTSLIHLDASVNNIESIEPTTFYQTQKLQTLKLNDNRLSVVPDLQHLKALTVLDLSSNVITTLDSSTFSKMQHLQVLRLTNNKLQTINTRQLLDHTPNLNVLYLNQNCLTVLHLTYATQLHTIHAAENNITSVHLMGMSSLQVVDLSHNKLSDLMFIGLVALRQLKVDHNNLTSIQKVASSLPNEMKTLDLAYNQLKDFNPSIFDRFKKLQILNLQNSGINRIDSNTFSGLSGLHTLDISHNNLKDFDLKYLANQNELIELFVDGNGLFSLERMNLSTVRLAKLKRIGISNNDWSCPDLTMLLQELNAKGITVHVERPADGQHVAFVACNSNSTMSVVELMEAATFATDQKEYMDYMMRVVMNSYEDMSNEYNDYGDEEKEIEESLNGHHDGENKSRVTGSGYAYAIAFWLMGMVFMLLSVGVVLLYRHNRIRNDRPYTLSGLLDL